jgi:hypothetical protein
MLFADDQILLNKSEDTLQYAIHNLSNTAEEFLMEINTGKQKLWLLKIRNQSEARYASVAGYWNKLILSIIWDVTYLMKEKRI